MNGRQQGHCQSRKEHGKGQQVAGVEKRNAGKSRVKTMAEKWKRGGRFRVYKRKQKVDYKDFAGR